jgi:hypothetical protein
MTAGHHQARSRAVGAARWLRGAYAIIALSTLITAVTEAIETERSSSIQ